MPRWRKELYILWGCSFIVQMGFSLIMPFLPLYLEALGIEGSRVDVWAGVIFSANFAVMAVISPVWGALSDRVGRKPMMLRSAFGMAMVVWLMGLVTSPWQLLGLRLLQGLAAGFIPAATAYMAASVPREKAGQALGLLSTGNVAGSILGPLVGGLLANWVGYRPIFFITSVTCLLGGAIVLWTIREQFTPQPRPQGTGLVRDLALVRQYPVVLSMLLVFYLTMASMLTSQPILVRFLRLLDSPESWLPFLSGLMFSVTGVATLITAPLVGRLSDQMGSKRLLQICLGGAAATFLLQGLVTTAWQMAVLRFALGLFTGGLLPAANSLIARTVPREMQGRIFGLVSSFMFLGNFSGPLIGGAVAATLGLRAVFPVTGLLLALNLLWVWVAVHEPQPKPELRHAD